MRPALTSRTTMNLSGPQMSRGPQIPVPPHTVRRVYTSEICCGLREFQASSAVQTFRMADSRVNGGVRFNVEALVLSFFLRLVFSMFGG